jgi:hypothetical protein
MSRIPMSALSKTWVCGRSLAGIVVSNPSRIMDVSLLILVCCQVEVSASGCSFVHKNPSECGVCN